MEFIKWLFKYETIIWYAAFNALVALITQNWFAMLGWLATVSFLAEVIQLKKR